MYRPKIFQDERQLGSRTDGDDMIHLPPARQAANNRVLA